MCHFFCTKPPICMKNVSYRKCTFDNRPIYLFFFSFFVGHLEGIVRHKSKDKEHLFAFVSSRPLFILLRILDYYFFQPLSLCAAIPRLSPQLSTFCHFSVHENEIWVRFSLRGLSSFFSQQTQWVDLLNVGYL